MPSLTHSRLCEYLSYDPDSGVFTRKLTQRRWKAGTVIAGRPDGHGYRVIGIDGQSFRAHRLAWFYTTGQWPPNDIDHINGIRDDNRWCNLRPATRAQNLRNSSAKPNKTGFKGVHKHGHRYRAAIRLNYKHIRLGSFETPEAAHEAYCRAAIRLHGQFANTG